MSRVGGSRPGRLGVLGAYFSGRNVSLSVVELPVFQLGVPPPGVFARGQVLDLVHFLEYIFVLDIHCQHLGKICQFGGCLCALRARVWRICIF